MSPFLFTDLKNPVLQAPRIMCRSRLGKSDNHKQPGRDGELRGHLRLALCALAEDRGAGHVV